MRAASTPSGVGQIVLKGGELPTSLRALGGLVAALFAIALAGPGSASAQAPPCAAGTNVQTASGPVCGTVANGVSEWLGIP